MGAPYIYDISRLRVKDLHSATYIYVVQRLRVNVIAYTLSFKAHSSNGGTKLSILFLCEGCCSPNGFIVIQKENI